MVSAVCHLLGDYLEAISKDFHKAAKVYKSNCEDFNYSKSCYKIGNYHMAGKGGVVQSQEKVSYCSIKKKVSFKDVFF